MPDTVSETAVIDDFNREGLAIEGGCYQTIRRIMRPRKISFESFENYFLTDKMKIYFLKGPVQGLVLSRR